MAVEDVDPGDETHRYGDRVPLPHDEESGGVNAPEPGEAVALDGNGNIKQAEQGDNIVGVLKTYPYYGDSQNRQIDQDQPATVKLQGSLKANVKAGVTAGTELGAPDEANGAAKGELGPASDTNTEGQHFVALGDAFTEDGDEYAEVMLR